MRNTRENVIKLLKAMHMNTHACANAYGDTEAARRLRMEALGLSNAISLLTEPDYFNEIWAIYFPSDGK